ncbi:hypothetical protein SAMN05192540_4002 [Maribacter dokdonensis]|uniref:Outer membrane efflux protein n=1 Tax=Maribacter dokdonensis TaxID=320912 RepID=A0A1H4WUF9_9FLAO|nr:hypothetical protein [Maribacter dokdonensis]SEC96358.1 hypothetical protein SAMN05192540_4002 [Maribacter dokdonensis]
MAKRLCLLGFLITLYIPTYSQSLEEYSIKESNKIDSTLLSLKTSKNLQYLSLAPSISYSKVTGVNVGVNLGSFVSFAQTKKRNKIEASKLENQLKERLESRINIAEEKEIAILDEYEILVLELDILDSKKELFLLDSLKYDNQEITFSEFTESKIAYKIDWKTAYTKIKKLSLQLERFENKFGYRPEEVKNLFETIENLSF